MIKFDNKQKGLLILTCVALIFLGYQVYALFHHNAMFKPIPKQQVRPVRIVHKLKHAAIKVDPVQVIAKRKKPQFLHLLDDSQKNYLKMLNQYELAHMKHQLLDEEIAVASVEKKLNQLRHENGVLMPSDVKVSDTLRSGKANSMPYRLSYIEQQQGKWMAMLSYNKRYHQVHVGSKLPEQFLVVDIDQEGIVLSQNARQWRLSFDGAIRLAETQTFGVHAEAKLLLDKLQTKKQPGRNKKFIQQIRTAAANSKSKPKAELKAKIRVVRPKPTGPFSIEMADEYLGAGDDWANLPLNLTLMPVKIHPMVEGPLATTRLLLADHPLMPSHYHVLTKHDPKTPVYSVESADGCQPKPANYSFEEQRVLSMPNSAYTIQLMGSGHHETVHQFIALNRLSKYVLDLPLKNRDTNWHVVLYGQYPTFSDAKKALFRLPGYLRSGGAWVRRVRDLKQQIKPGEMRKGYS